jgi:hypothetical protein
MSAPKIAQSVAIRSSKDTSSSVETSGSIWRLPGLDKVTFYAVALYLHVVIGNIKVDPLYRQPNTREPTRDFLDCLADCFARSKLQDARDHVSATAMVRNDNEKKITVYISKNKSYRGYSDICDKKLHFIENENEVFTKKLVDWFTRVAQTTATPNERLAVFQTTCEFSRSRLEHYIGKVSDTDIEDLDSRLERNFEMQTVETVKGWKKTICLIKRCKAYQADKSGRSADDDPNHSSLANCAVMAGKTRKHEAFRTLANDFAEL